MIVIYRMIIPYFKHIDYNKYTKKKIRINIKKPNK